MSNHATHIGRDHAEAVFRRGREPMEPLGFQPNWEDQPSRHKVYQGVTRIGLPQRVPDALGSLPDLLDRDLGPVWTDEGLDGLSALLRLSYGVLDRRLRVNWNQDVEKRVSYPLTTWGRGTASGGGMYPLEIYLVNGERGPLLPGVYHYSTAHHALDRLATGNVTERVRAALLDHPAARDADQFLLVSVRFWKNSFKYNSFCYHVVTQDLGALLGSWELLAAGLGFQLERVLWFADEVLNRVLGLDTDSESVLAVVPLHRKEKTVRPALAPLTSVGSLAGSGLSPVARPSYERSRKVIRFAEIERVHRAALVGDEPRPTVVRHTAALASTPPEPADLVELPAPAGADQLGTDLVELLRSRHSSFGAFTGNPPLGLGQLGTVLSCTTRASRYRSDFTIPDGSAPLVRLHVLANRVDGLPSGSYHYHRDGHRLGRVVRQEMGQFLQHNYFLQNYNQEQVGAVLAISGRLDAMLDRYGNRGYRMLNSEVGGAAQLCYLAATALGIGCGAVLGFDNLAMDEVLGLTGTDERTFLFLLLGNEHPRSANVDLRLL